MDRLSIIRTVRDYLARGDIEGLRRWLDDVEPQLTNAINQARARRERALTRATKPIEDRGRVKCFDEADLYWAFSKQTLRRLGIE
ncbi:hypothetical protein [Vulcanisaeta souniana]|uniref:Uncharacterized protein n=1 Tax=Vulcanisaeta souniana JCM 11219 TaxID=1293586 RepID=A0A830EKJ6_9CREN|nr:hypothetical protein [Vulcanisaeta souniana]BDR92219.1 hypothetical protein Vsou_13120 [Vulcanisaeta souniana JCM 11219]GGI85984.1 hypothetical protein GCM10007112_23690 [Vulcanisaeta souniana JCM 11219]